MWSPLLCIWHSPLTRNQIRKAALNIHRQHRASAFCMYLQPALHESDGSGFDIHHKRDIILPTRSSMQHLQIPIILQEPCLTCLNSQPSSTRAFGHTHSHPLLLHEVPFIPTHSTQKKKKTTLARCPLDLPDYG